MTDSFYLTFPVSADFPGAKYNRLYKQAVITDYNQVQKVRMAKKCLRFETTNMSMHAPL